MARKKAAKKGQRPGDDTNNGPEEHPRIQRGGNHWGFAVYRELLAEEQRQQRIERQELPALIRRHVELLEAGDQDALDEWLLNEGAPVTRAARAAARERLESRQAWLEDFLYYQTAIHRRRRMNAFKTGKFGKQKIDIEEKGKPRWKKTWRFTYGDNVEVRRMLDAFDAMGTGLAAHRNGEMNASGQPSIERDDGCHQRPVGPRELRLWTPPARRAPVGLTNEPHQDLETNGLTLEHQAIEDERLRIDFIPNQTPNVVHASHNDRRIAERQAYARVNADDGESWHDRPSTSAWRPRTDTSGKTVVDSFQHMQTQAGLFISALESSDDWRTSYDYLGCVKSGVHEDFEVQVSDVRNIEGPPGENDDDEDDDVDGARGQTIVIEFEDDIYSEPKAEAEARRAEEAAKKSRSKKGKGAKKANGAATNKGGKGAKKKGKTGESEFQEVEADTDYPHEWSEFTRKSKKKTPRYLERMSKRVRGDEQDFPVSTDWAEVTSGRREWHVYEQLSPASSVDSPPHSPIHGSDIEAETLPGVFPSADLPPLKRNRRRCERAPDICRVWWAHAPDECWPVRSTAADEARETLQRPERGIPEFALPDQGLEIYDERLTDHYGMYGKEGAAVWPRVGIRVPYEPMTFDDLKPKPKEDTETGGGDAIEDAECGVIMKGDPKIADIESDDTRGFIAKDAASRDAHEMHSMAVPIIAEPQRPWGWFPEDGAAAHAGGSGSEASDSEDEGDLFRASYNECSQAPGGQPPVPDSRST